MERGKGSVLHDPGSAGKAIRNLLVIDNRRVEGIIPKLKRKIDR